jgi:ATP-binding cassette, subfamily B, bacterial
MSTPQQSAWGILLKYLRPQGWRAAGMAALLFGGIGLQVANPQILRLFIDRAAGGSSNETLMRLAALFVVVALATQAVTVGATYLSEQVGWSATNMLRADLALHCLRLDMPFHHHRTPGEMIERIDGDVTALATFFSQFIVRVAGSVLLLLGVLVALFLADWRVGLALSLFALLALAVLLMLRDRAVPYVTQEREANAGLFGFIEERLAGLDDIRANRAGSYVMSRYHGAAGHLVRTALRAQTIGSVVWVSTMTLFAAGYAVALGLGAGLYQSGAITLGTVYLVFQYTRMLRAPLEQMSDQLRQFQRAAAGMQRVSELARLAPDVRDGDSARLPDGALAVEFDDVSFSYDEEENVLHNISFRLEPGRVLGVLGRTGSGKTTLTRLLVRLYDISEGSIRLGDVDVRDVPLEHLRARVGIVTQDVQLFQAPVRDNLTLFDAAIPDARIIEVLEGLGMDDWLRSLPDGLDTELGSGAGLSAGEAQLLAFARVFLRDPGLVILDEASSRLDPATERRIERAVDRLLAGRTGIIIAHRLATVQRADAILVLEDGRIREHGPRAELVADPDSRFSELLRTGMETVLV